MEMVKDSSNLLLETKQRTNAEAYFLTRHERSRIRNKMFREVQKFEERIRSENKHQDLMQAFAVKIERMQEKIQN